MRPSILGITMTIAAFTAPFASLAEPVALKDVLVYQMFGKPIPAGKKCVVVGARYPAEGETCQAEVEAQKASGRSSVYAYDYDQFGRMYCSMPTVKIVCRPK